MICPCAVCETRFVGCHAECDEYKAWHEQRIKEHRERKEAKQIQHQVFEYNQAAFRRIQKRSKKK